MPTRTPVTVYKTEHLAVRCRDCGAAKGSRCRGTQHSQMLTNKSHTVRATDSRGKRRAG